jgi:hypothetical protein
MKMRRNIRFNVVAAALIPATLALTFAGGCESRTGTGALIGGAAGAGIGQAVGRNTAGTVIGGAVGAGAGALIGHESEKQQSNFGRDRQPPPPPEQTDNAVIVNVTNSNGSVTPVRMVRQGSGWVGPKGEYYSSLPTPEQLRPIYGF